MTTFDPAAYGEGCAEFYDQIYPTVDPALLVALRRLAGAGPALELGPGTGRVALPLSRSGVEVWGVDASRAMLARLRGRDPEGKVRVLEGDFAAAALGTSFRLVYALVSTFDLLPSRALQQACLANVARHLVSGGVFVNESFGGGVAEEVEERSVPIETPRGTRPYRFTILATAPELLEAMAAGAGLAGRERWSDWRGTPWADGAPRHISVFVKP